MLPGKFSRSAVSARLAGVHGPTLIAGPAGALSSGPVNALIHPLLLNWSRSVCAEGPWTNFFSPLGSLFHSLTHYLPPSPPSCLFDAPLVLQRPGPVQPSATARP